ncbi:MAG: 2-oxo acid dehydrogenase subunit E2 [Caldilineaceae bacterium]|nr:2-oxo acid dehydrogenase subunit E2 [Caldilineaceae bacterium]
MATNVKLPDMGEGIDEVTINRWRVKEGSSIEEGAVLVDVATDKVDTEIPSPASGTILKLNFGPGELVSIDAVIAVIGEAGEAVDSAEETSGDDAGEEESGPSEEEAMPEAETGEPLEKEMQQAALASGDEEPMDEVKATPVARRMAAQESVPLSQVSGTGPGGQIRKSDVLGYVEQKGQQATPPASKGLSGDLADVPNLGARRVAADYNVNLRDVAEGRPLSSLTRHDVLRFVAKRDNRDYLPTEPEYPGPEDVASAQPAQTGAEQLQVARDRATTETIGQGRSAKQKPKAETPQPKPSTQAETRNGDELVPHTRMRTLIARNTAQSAFSAPHVTTMWDVNMTAVLEHRKAHKNEFAKAGVNLTITAYFFQAMIAGIRAVPAVNSSWSEEGLLIRRQIHIGMAVALPADKYGVGGLIVPVIKNADDLNLMGFARKVNDLAQRARNNQLTADELQGGTLTLTNYGTGGSIFQTPIIVQPQVGILGVGAIEKRPIVVSQGHPLEANTGDYLTFAPMTTLGFSYDHRVLDGASADAFCAAVKDALENWK